MVGFMVSRIVGLYPYFGEMIQIWLFLNWVKGHQLDDLSGGFKILRFTL